jgi:protein gp37
LFDLIRRTRNLTWLILTKRIDLAVRDADFQRICGEGASIWLGTSVEDQKRFEERISALTRNPARVSFLSAEPLLGSIDIGGYENAIDWVIIGGESGPRCRPMKIEWALDLRRQCQRANIACFVKQLGGYPNKYTDIDTFPDELQVQELPPQNTRGKDTPCLPFRPKGGAK